MSGFVAIVLGSESDSTLFDESRAEAMLREIGVAYEVSAISAHRNPRDLDRYCDDAIGRGAQIFIGAAGMSAALPGALASFMTQHGDYNHIPVLGVALPSKEFPNALDALLAEARMPPGVPVGVMGIAVAGFRNAVLQASQILALSDEKVRAGLRNYLSKNTKEAKIRLSAWSPEGE